MSQSETINSLFVMLSLDLFIWIWFSYFGRLGWTPVVCFGLFQILSDVMIITKQIVIIELSDSHVANMKMEIVEY